MFIGLLLGGVLLSSEHISNKFNYQASEMPVGRRKLLSTQLLGGPPFFYGYYDLVGIISSDASFSFRKLEIEIQELYVLI